MLSSSEEKSKEFREKNRCKENPSKPARIFLVISGFLSLSIGIVGIFLPIVPTTPLILLAAACFLKSSNNLYQWITKNKTFGRYIQNYLNYGRVPTKSKFISIALVWVCISISVYLAEKTWLRILLLLVACGVSIHLALLKTLESQDSSEKSTEKSTTEEA